MTGKIFKSVFITALAVMTACFLIVFISTYNSYTDLAFSELEIECLCLKVGIDEYGEAVRTSEYTGKRTAYCAMLLDSGDVVDEVAKRLSSVSERAGVRINVNLREATVLGNRMTLEEIVYNLADNAIKYGKQGGFVNISVQSGEKGAILSVEDNGIGIPEDKRERVFERFYRVDKSHSKNKGGTGLGLSIVKHAVAYHKGEIFLESEEGMGTKVTVVFPPVK